MHSGQYSTSQGGNWHPGVACLDAFHALLETIGASVEGELLEHTFKRSGKDRGGEDWWVSRTLDFARGGIDPLKYAGYHEHVHVVRSVPFQTASDHLPVAVEWRKIAGRKRFTPPNPINVNRSMPDWLMYDARFLDEVSEAVHTWTQTQSHGLAALVEFQDLAQACAKTYLDEQVCLAQTAAHKFDVAMYMYVVARDKQEISVARVSKWLQIHPYLRALVHLNVDVVAETVFIIGTDALLGHLRELVSQVVEERSAQERFAESPEGILDSMEGQHVSAGSTTLGSQPHSSILSDLKTALRKQSNRLCQIWHEDRGCYVTTTGEMGEHMRNGAVSSQGESRGNPTAASQLLNDWGVDLSRVREGLSLTEISNIILSTADHKAPGTNGVRGRLYKIHAGILAPVFHESFTQLCGNAPNVPPHLTDLLWLPIPKDAHAATLNRIRDLELPNEDAKILARMISKLLDEGLSRQLKEYQQAFVTDGSIAKNIVGIAEEISIGRRRQVLSFFLFLDCSKGFNMLSWEWVERVLQKGGLPQSLINAMSSLTCRHVAFLSLCGRVFDGVVFRAGYSQGNPLSVWIYILAIDPFLRAAAKLDGVHAVFGFCDDWTISAACMDTAERLSHLIRQFEEASGQRINREKSVWIPSRTLSQTERATLASFWARPLIRTRHKSLGYWFGPEASMEDLTDEIFQKVHGRILELERLRLSLTNKILSLNVFVLSLVSYVFGYTYVGDNVQRRLCGVLSKFLSRIPWCRLRLFCHLRSLFKCHSQLQDPFLMNVAMLLSNFLRLEATGVLTSLGAQRWANDQNLMSDPMRPFTSFQKALVGFQTLSGNTLEEFVSEWAVTHRKPFPKLSAYRVLYKHLLGCEVQVETDYVKSRLEAKGLSWEPVCRNLQVMPTTVPGSHCLNLVRRLLNGEMTTHRMHTAVAVQIVGCPFCAEQDGDSTLHRDTCEFLRQCRLRLFCDHEGDVAMLGPDPWTPDQLWLQAQLEGGRELQQMLAYLNAVVRCRSLIIRGYSFRGLEDIVNHLRRLSDDPWLVGSPLMHDRSERRRLRALPPIVRPGWVVYASDGAARGQGSGHVRGASSGAVRYILDSQLVAASCGRSLGDVSNNVAEYSGVLDALRHALRRPHANIVFRVDSKLVELQLNYRWKCASPDLIPLFAEAVTLLHRIRSTGGIALVEHIYREFNGDADGVCNRCLDIVSNGALPDMHGLVLNNSWI